MVFLQSLYLRYPSDRRLDYTDGLVTTGKSDVSCACQDWRPVAPAVQSAAHSPACTSDRDTKRCMPNGGEQLFVGALGDDKRRSPMWTPSTPFRLSVHDILLAH